MLGSLAVLLALGTATPGAAAVPATRDVTAAQAVGAAAESYESLIRWENDAVSTTYGDSWSFTFYFDDTFNGDLAGVIEINGPLSGFAADAVILTRNKAPGSVSDSIGYLNPPLSAPPLDADTYQLSPRLEWAFYDQQWSAEPATPATLTVAPAALAEDARVQQDSNNPVVTVISAALAGEYIDRWAWTSTDPNLEPRYARIPGGTWRIVVTDDQGATVLEESIVRANGAVPTATLAVTDLPPDTTLSASVTFTLDASSAGNFTLTQSQPFGFTTPAEARPILVVDDESLDETVAVADPGPTVPVGLVGFAGLIAVGLATTVVFQVVRMRRGALPAPAGGDAPDSAPVDPAEQTS